MAHPIVSRKKAQIFSFILFILGIVTLAIFQDWWPGIMLAFGFPIALREFLLGKRYDALISLCVFSGAYVTVEFNIPWDILLPMIFIIGGIHIFFRDFFKTDPETEVEEEEEISQEIEEEKEEENR